MQAIHYNVFNCSLSDCTAVIADFVPSSGTSTKKKREQITINMLPNKQIFKSPPTLVLLLNI